MPQDEPETQTKRRLSSANLSPLRLVAAGPQADLKANFQAVESGDVCSAFVVEVTGHGRVRDDAAAGDRAHTFGIGDDFEGDGKTAVGFGNGLRALLLGPNWAEASGGGPNSADHARMLATNAGHKVHEGTETVTPDRSNGAWKHRNSAKVRDVTDRIDKYQPRIDPEHWAVIGEFVKQAVRDAEPETTYSAGNLLSVVNALTHWSWMEGQPLERRVIFDRWNIERFVSSGCPKRWTDATRGNSRSMLFRVAEALLGPDASTPRVAPIKCADPLVPYTPDEIVQFYGWATSQIGVEWRRSATALLALALGAGLTTQDLGVLRRHHVSNATDGTTFIDVPGRRARRTVLVAEWEDDFADSLVGLDPDDFVFRRNRQRDFKNLVTGLVAETTGLHKPNAQRLRVTWLVGHLASGTPIDVLIGAAGLTSLKQLTRYLKFVDPVSEEKASTYLRLGGVR